MIHRLGILSPFIVILFSHSLAVAEIAAPQRHQQKHAPLMEMLEELDLSPAQKKELRELRKERLGEGGENMRKRMGDSLQDLNQAVSRGATEKELRGILDELEDAANEAAASSREYRAILTEKQRQKLDGLLEKRQKERHEMSKKGFDQRSHDFRNKHEALRRPAAERPFSSHEPQEEENPLSDF